MNYIDTNVIISFISKSDVNHSRALRILDNNEGKVTSPVAILELKSVLSRTTDLGVDEIEAFADYLAEIKIEVPEVDMNKVLNNASDIATTIRMKTLDILHLSASMILDVNGFVTFDHEFLEKKNEIEGIGLKIIH